MAGARWLAIVTLASGCNQIFGLEETRPRDAAAIPDGVPLVVHLSYALAATDPATGKPAPLDYPAIPLAGPLEISALDGSSATQPTYNADGTFEVPPTLSAVPWRLVFQPAGDIPHELQWQPGTGAHVTIPLFGRLDRLTAPTGSGYTITPTGYTGSHTQHAVYTTGIWTVGAGTFVLAQVDYDFPNNARSLSGLRGRPDPTLGDRMLLIDYGTAAPCRQAVGSADFAAALQMGVHTSVAPAWQTLGNRDADPTVTVDTNDFGRLADVAELAGTTRAAALRIGYVPSDHTSVFTTPPAASAPADPAVLGLASPTMLELQACSDVTVNPPPFHDPLVLTDLQLPSLGYVELTSVRQVSGGPKLVSGLAMAARRIGGLDGSIVFAHTAPHATAIQLASTGGMADLAGTADAVPVPATTGDYQLTFTPSGGTADYWDVILHEVNGTAITPKRIFTILGSASTVQIAPDRLPPGQYVFEIRGYDGRVGARSGDFRDAELPQTSTTLFTRTFVIQ
ncbi:MAG TPA: hypothetical protein VFQ53_33860 [Kofleriaceae bacterium]|nr:hypothetical protein [Kofleriaceae bacterium]